MDPKDSGHLKDLLEVYGLKNLIKLPTRIGKTSSTLLDLILTNNTRRIFSSGVVDADISDHSLIYTLLRTTAPRLRSRKIQLRSLKNFYQDLFLRDLHNVPFQVMEVFDDIDDKQYLFESLYLDILNEHAPQKQAHIRGNIKNQIPFMNEQWRKAIRHRNKLWKKFTHRRTDANYAEYKKQRNKCTSFRRKAIKDHFKNKSKTDNPRAFWQAYRPFMYSRSSKQASDITLIENDVVITDKKELAKLFNNYFVHIVDDVQDIKEHNFGNEFSAHPSIRAIAEENRRKNAIHNFNFKYTNKTQVEKLLSNINARKACGHDTITPRLLKESASAISGPLAELMNESIKQCKYPSRWKMGQVTPLFKKNDELSKENYRPVTVLPALNNVFEKLLASQLDQFYSEILSDYISAYRRHYSCETSLMRLTEDWRRSLDNKQIVAVISMDLSKAFDTIPHGLLLAKLKAHGVNSSSCMLLKDYLHGRMQRVKVGNTSSDWQEVRRGVPQGSVLGPMFFNIFINDLFLQIKTVQLNIYADDGQLYTADTDPVSLERRISREVSSSNAWYEINGMIVNPARR